MICENKSEDILMKTISFVKIDINPGKFIVYNTKSTKSKKTT